MRLYEQLLAKGVPKDVSGDVYADLGDMTTGLEKIQDLFEQVAAGTDVSRALDRIESECQDHLRGHLKSIVKTTKTLRKLKKDLQEPVAPSGAGPI